MASTVAKAVLLVALICGAAHPYPVAAEEAVTAGLSFGFYDKSCPIVSHIVEYYVGEAFRTDAGIAPALVRTLFHDCFPQGCDASVLLNGTGSEQGMRPNLTLRPAALKLVEDIRRSAHAACGPVVSCADILALAARDALVEAGGPGYDLPLGRRDGLAPASEDLVFTLPAPFIDVPTLIKSFGDRGLSVADLVALLKSDQGLGVHQATNQDAIFEQFAKSMVKMSQMDVLTGTQGEIRRSCAVPNKRAGVETAAAEGLAAEM